MEDMTFYNWLCLFGIPTAIVAIVKMIWHYIKEDKADNLALKLGLQALLRSQLIGDYNKWSERGYAPIYARENFENCWKQYHELGANGVMDGIHEKFENLPLHPPENKEVIG